MAAGDNEGNGLRWVARWEDDDDPDLSWLGEFVGANKAVAPYVDRKSGLLLGEETEEPECPDDDAELTSDQWGLALAAYKAWEDQPYEVLANVGSCWQRYQSEYWVPCNNVPLGSVVNWAHVTDEEVQASLISNEVEMRRFDIAIPDGGDRLATTRALDIFYICRDYARLQDYGSGWAMTGCILTLYVNDTKVDSASLWGIESDCGQEYRDEIEAELKSQIMANLPQDIERLRQALELLETEGEVL